MAKIKTRIEGVDKTLKKLSRGKVLFKEGVKQIIDEVTMEALREVKRLTPVDTGATQALWMRSITKVFKTVIKAEVTHVFNKAGSVHPINNTIVNRPGFNLLEHLEYNGGITAAPGMIRIATELARALLNKRLKDLMREVGGLQ